MTTLSSSLNPSTVGQQVTFTAVVTASGYQGTPTGTVTFTIDGQDQPPVPLALVGGADEAQFSHLDARGGIALGHGRVQRRREREPEQRLAADADGERAEGLQTTTITLSPSVNPSTVGQQVTFTAVVSPGDARWTPTGTVTFTIDGTPQTPVPLQCEWNLRPGVFLHRDPVGRHAHDQCDLQRRCGLRREHRGEPPTRERDRDRLPPEATDRPCCP